MALPVWTDAQVLNQLNSGFKWSGSTITYAFPSTIAGMYSGSGEGNFAALSAAAQAKAQLAVGLWDDLIAPDMLQVAPGNYQTANLEFALGIAGIGYAHAYFPTVGSVWLNSSYTGTNDLTAPTVGRHGFLTYVHEIGHALGLEHMGDYENSSAPSSFQDSTVYSVMSYFGPSWGAGVSNGEGQVAWADWVAANGQRYSPQTPMLNDIMAMQSMYGIETTTRVGDTVYGFNSNVTGAAADVFDFTRNANPILTIFDSSGNDTLDVSGWSTTSIISLASGSFSSTNSMTNNIAIAYTATIENARTGSGNDTIHGNALGNVLFGGAGTDTLNGDEGNDTLEGGVGADQLNGGNGTDTATYASSVSGVTVNLTTNVNTGGEAQGDTFSSIENIIGSAVKDHITGNSGTNSLYGGAGDDVLIGGGGTDIFYGGMGSDQITGGSSNLDLAYYMTSTSAVNVNLTTNVNTGGEAQGDTLTSIERIYGSIHNDILTGDAFINYLYGQNGDDTLNGMGGNDILYGGVGTDTLNGDEGNDTLEGGVGADQLNGGNGTDTATYASSVSGVTVNLTTNVNTGGEAQGDTFSSIENIIGSAVKDHITGNSGTNSLYGGAGDDVLIGGGGTDIFYGGMGSDQITGGSSNLDLAYYTTSTSAVNVNLTTNVNTGGEAQGDTLTSIERIYGSIHNDILTGDAFINYLYGQNGDDTLNGMGGNDILYGGVGTDTLNGDEGNDTLEGGVGADQLNGGNGTDTATYASSVSGVTVNLTTNVNTGGEAQGDTFSSIENIIGSAVKDHITGNSGTNSLYGGAGDDVLIGGGGTDIFYGGMGSDQITGGSSNLDLAYYTTSTSAVNVNLTTNVNTGGEAQGDTLTSIERIYGSIHNDILTGDAFINYLYGQNGDDTLNGMGGNDILYGGLGTDTFHFSIPAFGQDIIKDFVSGVDFIRFDLALELDLSLLEIVGQGTNSLVISVLGTDSHITVECNAPLTLTDADFLFA